VTSIPGLLTGMSRAVSSSGACYHALHGPCSGYAHHIAADARGRVWAAANNGGTERRIALIVGNNEYHFVAGLNNAVADARAMKRDWRRGASK